MTQQEFEQIAPELRDEMLRIGRDFFGNEMDADDVAQEGLLVLWRMRERMEPDRRHTGLAIRVAKHCCMDLVRKRRRHESESLPNEAVALRYEKSLSATPQEELEASELKTAIGKAIGHLNPSERRLFEMRQLDGLSNDEIAQQTNIPKPSVKSMVSTARKKVFEELKRTKALPPPSLKGLLPTGKM